MMPHGKSDSKMQKKESLFAVNEIAEMKNCSKCLLFEGRKKKDVYMWAANVARGPSIKLIAPLYPVTRFSQAGICMIGFSPQHSAILKIFLCPDLPSSTACMAGLPGGNSSMVTTVPSGHQWSPYANATIFAH